MRRVVRVSLKSAAGALVATMVTMAGCTGPDTQDGAERVEQGLGTAGSCRSVTLTASRYYRPKRHEDDERSFAPPMRFAIPREIAVLAGDAGNRRAFIEYSLRGCAAIKCWYKGNGDRPRPPRRDGDQGAGGDAYEFERCEGRVRAGEVVEADQVSLRVKRGDPWEPDPDDAVTSVRLVLSEVAPCRGPIDAGVDATADARVDATAGDAADAGADVIAGDAHESGAADATGDVVIDVGGEDVGPADAGSDAEPVPPDAEADAAPDAGLDAGGEDAGADAPIEADAGPMCTDASCADQSPCTVDRCLPSGECEHEPVANGTSCDGDNDLCTGAAFCSKTGECVQLPPPVLDNSSPCLVERCDPLTGVTRTPGAAGTVCGGDVCVGIARCDGVGGCISGKPAAIDDMRLCTLDACHPVLGVTHTPLPVGTSCSTGSACTTGDACDATGDCAPGVPVATDDGQICTADSCNPVTGVQHAPMPEGTVCGGDVCVGESRCSAGGTCVPGVPPLLDDNRACTIDACSVTGGVTHTPVAAGTACGGDLCVGVSRCDAQGDCIAGTPPVLDTSNPCVEVRCDPVLGVVATPRPQGFACPDDTVCNGNEVCNGAGTCAAGTPPVVDDQNVCSDDSCDPVLGVLHSPRPAGTSCANLDLCDGNELCSAAGECLVGTPPTVDDGNRCTVDQCSPATGVSHTPIAGCDPTPTTSTETPFETRASLMGTVLTTAGAPVTGYTVQVLDLPGTTPRNDVQFTTATDGSFRIRLTSFPDSEPEQAPAHHVEVVITSPGTLTVYRTAYVRSHDVQDLGKIVVLARDPAVTMIGAEGGTARDSTGRMEVVIPPGALASPQPIRITPIVDQRENMPARLPDGTATAYGFDLEPESLAFLQPVTLRIQNSLNLPTSLQIPTAIWNKSLGEWTDLANAVWDGSRFAVQMRAFPNSPGDVNPSVRGPNAPDGDDDDDDDSPPDEPNTCGSKITFRTGDVSNWVTLPATVRRGRSYAVQLNYTSDLAGSSTLGAAGATVDQTVLGAGAPAPLVRRAAPVRYFNTVLLRGGPAEPNGDEFTCAPVTQTSSPIQSSPRVRFNGEAPLPLTVPAGGLELKVSRLVKVPTKPDGTITPPGFITEKVEILSGARGVCVPTIGRGFGVADGDGPLWAVNLDLGVLRAVTRSVFVNHRISSPFGAGWGVDGVHRLYKNPRADHAVLVHGSGKTEHFRPRVDVKDLGAVPGRSYARDPQTAEAFALDDTGKLSTVAANGTTTQVATFSLGGEAVRGLAVTYVAGERRFLVKTNLRYVDITPAGVVRTLWNSPVGPGFRGTSGLVGRGDYAYFTSAPGPSIVRVRLTDAFPAVVAINGTSSQSVTTNNPHRPLKEVSFGEPQGLAFGPDGSLFMADRRRHTVYRIHPDPADGYSISPNSLVTRGFGNGTQSILPLGQKVPSAEFSISQPVLLSAAPSGEIWMFTSQVGVLYDPASDTAKYMFRTSRTRGEITFEYLWGDRGSVLAMDAQRLLVQRNFSLVRLDVTPLSSRWEPLRHIDMDAQGRGTLVDSTAEGDMIEAYDPAGRLVDRRSRQGDPILGVSYIDATSGRIDRLTDGGGTATTFQYSGADQKLSAVTDPAGRRTEFQIDASGDLRSVTEPSEPGDTVKHEFDYDRHHMTKKKDPRGDETTYGYRADGSVSEVHKPDGQVITGIAAALGGQVRYDGSGRPFQATSYVDERGVSHVNTLNSRSLFNGDVYTADGKQYSDAQLYLPFLGGDPSIYGFSVKNNLIGRSAGRVVNGASVGDYTEHDPQGRVWKRLRNGATISQFTYTADDQVAVEDRVLEENAVSAPADKFVYTYDANGRKSSFKRTLGAATFTPEFWTYRPDGLVDSHTSRGVVTTFTYDSVGNMTQSSARSVADNSPGLVQRLLDYNAAGLPAEVQDGITTKRYAFDVRNRLRTSTDDAGNTTTYSYENEACGCSHQEEISAIHTPDLLAGQAWRFTYGAKGRLASRTDPDGNIEAFEYDPTTGDQTKAIDALNRETLFRFDQLGREASVRDPAQRERMRTYTYMTHGGFAGPNLLAGSGSSTSTSTSLSAALPSGAYQLGSNVVDTTHALPHVTLYRDATTEVSYAHRFDNFGRELDKVLRGGAASASTDWNSFINNPNNFAFSATTSYTSGLVPLVRQWTSNGDFGNDHFTHTQHDDVLTSVHTQAGYENVASYDYKFDSQNRPAGWDVVFRGFFPANVNSRVSIRQTRYPSGQLATQSDPDGSHSYFYDRRGLLERLSVEGEGDYELQYDELGRNTYLRFPDGHVRYQTHNTRGNITSRCYEYRTVNGELDDALTRCYGATYDARGNTIGVSDPEGAYSVTIDEIERVARVDAVGVPYAEEYEYNSLGALSVNASQALDTRRPRLDGNGSADSAIPRVLGGHGVTVDSAGNITSLLGAALTYDRRGRLVTYTDQGSTTKLIYDAQGQRVGKVGPITEFYVYDSSGNIVATLDAAASSVKESYLFERVDHPLRRRSANGAVAYYEVDISGNVRRLRLPGGTDIGGYRYTAFGQSLSGIPSNPLLEQPLQWKGRPRMFGDVYDMRARAWSPALGAFLQVDDFKYHDAQSTLWGWPGQNPLTYADPSGHGRDCDNCKLLVAAYAVACGAAAVVTPPPFEPATATWCLASVAALAKSKCGPICEEDDKREEDRRRTPQGPKASCRERNSSGTPG